MNKKLLDTGEKMKNFLGKYGKHLIIFVLSLFIGVDKTVDIAGKINAEDVGVVEAGEIAIVEALRPMIEDVVSTELQGVNASIILLSDDITELKNYNVRQITNNAIAAYSKVYTIEDLEDSPLKKVSITDGLLLESCYDILFAIDSERTKLFYDYLIGSTQA